MRARTRITWVALVLLAWGVGTPGPAGAADPATTVVVTTNPAPFAALGYLHVTDSIVTAGTGALDWIGDNVAVGTHVTILIDGTDGTAYPGGFTIGEDDDISIEGFPPGEPEQVIIEGQLAGGPVIRLSNVGESVTIEGVTLTGGDVGLHIEGATAQIAPSVDRCYLRGNQGHGVEVTGDAAPTLRNLCVADNTGDGIHVATTGFVAGGATTTIIHCTIRNNGGSGVLAMSDVGVSVQNTLVWQNGQVGAAPQVFEEFLVDDSDPGWEAMPQWEFGQPLGQGGDLYTGGPDPNSGYTGSNVYGINLNGDYTHYPGPLVAPVPIPIGATFQSALDVPPSAYPLPIRDVNVYFDITHPTVENVTLRLTSPGGTTVDLLSGIGGVGDDFQGTILDDDADDPINDPTFEPPYTGWFQPENSLAAFDGLGAEGIWQLEVKNEATDCGLLDEPFGGAVPDWSGDWLVDDDGGDFYFHRGADDVSFYNGPEATEWRDYQFRSRFRLPLTVAGDYEAAFIFRRQNDTDYYEFGYRYVEATDRGTFFFAKEEAGIRTDNEFGTAGSPIITRNVWHDITITVQGDSLSLLTGDVFPLGITSRLEIDTSFAEGGIGFRATQDTWFDDVCVTSLDEGVLERWGLYIVPDEPRYLTTGPLNFSGQVDVELQFEQWLNTSPSTTATLEASLDGATWDPPILDTAGAEQSANDWTLVTHDLSAYDEASSVFLRWGYDVAETALPCSGWNIDDIQFFGASPDVGGLVYTGDPSNTPNLQASANYVWENSSLNYIGFYPDALSIPDTPAGPPAILNPRFKDDVDPPSDWRGKLDQSSQMEGTAPSAGVGHDFEGELRLGTADIGADEVDGGNFGRWEDCLVYPDPAGQLDPGGLTVEVWVTGSLDVADAWGAPLDDPSDRVFVLPQGIQLMDPGVIEQYTWPDYYSLPEADPFFDLLIRLRYVGRGDQPNAYGHFSYIFDNMDPVATSVTSDTNEPILGDTIADGHAVVHMYVGGITVPVTLMDPQVHDPGGVSGRDFLIDTVPPLVEAVLTIDSVAAVASPGPYGTLGVSFDVDDITHPYVVAPSIDYPQANPALLGLGSHATYAPCPQTREGFEHGILVSGEDQVKLFYNVGSWANDYYGPLLDLALVAYLYDQTVEEAFPGIAPAGRQVSGFLTETTFSGTPIEIVDANPLAFGDQPPALWRDADGIGNLDETFVGMELQVFPGEGENNGDFDAYLGNDYVPAEWRFQDVRDSAPGIPIDLPVVAGQGRLHFSGTFGAVDRAGNGPYQLDHYSDYVQSLGGAGIVAREVDVWWLLGLRDDIRLVVEAREVPGIYPEVTWQLEDDYLDLDETNSEKPAALYCFGIWVCEEHGFAGDAPYETLPIRGSPWWGWAPDHNRMLTPDEFKRIEDDMEDREDSIKDRWVLVVAAAADVAGNVGWWPGTMGFGPGPTLSLDGNRVTFENVAPNENRGDNWVRFYIPASEIDTTLSPTLFYVEPDDTRTNLGAAPIVAYPTARDRYVLGVFDIGLVVPALSTGENLFARVEVEEDGQRILDEELPPDARNRVVLELGERDPDADLHLGDPARVVNYVVRVTAQTEEGGVVKRRDPSPAHFSFKVVPGTVAGYLEGAGTDVGEQPVKQFESDVK